MGLEVGHYSNLSNMRKKFEFPFAMKMDSVVLKFIKNIISVSTIYGLGGNWVVLIVQVASIYPSYDSIYSGSSHSQAPF